MRTTLTASFTLVAASLLAPCAWAADDPRSPAAGPQSSADAAQLQEVVVTAGLREENLQDVPSTVTALGGAFLDSHQVDSAFDIVSRVPNLTYSAFSRSQGIPTFRGSSQSSDDAPGIDAPVAIFVDDVYQGRILNWDISSFDADRIEVLHGPQGTLFGRNVVGGAISIITRKPTDTFEAGAEVSTGNYSYLGTKAYVSGPLTSDLSARLSVFTQGRNGYTTNLVTGQKLDALDVKGGRAQLLYQPSDDFKYLLSGSLTRDDSQGQSRDYIGVKPQVPGYAGLVNDNDPSTSQDAFDGGVHINTAIVSGTGTWKLKFADLVSISAFSTTDFNQPTSDVGGAPVPVLTQEIDEHLRQFSQELRLVSRASDSRMQWVAGLYFINIEDRRNLLQATYLQPGSFLGDIQEEIFGNNDPQSFDSLMKITSRSYAGYGQLTYSPLKALDLTLGGRYSYDSKSGSLTTLGDSFVLLPSGPFDIPLSDHWGAFTPKATIAYHINDDVMTYLNFSRGYKSGGFTDHGRNSVDDFRVPLNPEYASSYEAGLKSEWLDRRLVANLTGYHVNYTALQVSEYRTNGTFLVANGDALANGADLELTVRPVRNLDTYFNYSYFSGHYTSFGADTGHQLSTPRGAFTAGFDYRWPLTSDYTLAMNVDVQHKDRYFINADNEPALSIKYDAIVDASLSVETASGWAVSIWGKNLRNERALAYGNDLAAFFLSTAQYQAGDSAVSATYVPPVTYGISFRYSH